MRLWGNDLERSVIVLHAGLSAVVSPQGGIKGAGVQGDL
ncbi:hypothetical protein Ga0080559_TMP1165 [Salipiger profundus]|uniref:Uncharacterized protein n=1 Tax=Salipiger profundus TaxID=1229727 RepID=A0A1U7D1E4_9RHOB|nr:hypothetical protein Ga0080559_TMP1165 [Salipiger profundus]